MELVGEPMMGTYVTCMQCANVLTAREEAHLRITGTIPAAVTTDAPPRGAIRASPRAESERLVSCGGQGRCA